MIKQYAKVNHLTTRTSCCMQTQPVLTYVPTLLASRQMSQFRVCHRQDSPLDPVGHRRPKGPPCAQPRWHPCSPLHVSPGKHRQNHTHDRRTVLESCDECTSGPDVLTHSHYPGETSLRIVVPSEPKAKDTIDCHEYGTFVPNVRVMVT